MDVAKAGIAPFSEAWVAQHAAQGASLAGGLSDRNVLFQVDGMKYVLHNIETDSELYMMKEAAKLNAAPRVLASFPDKKLVVMEFIPCNTITPQDAQKHAREIGSSLKKVHHIPLSHENGVGFVRANQVRWDYIQEQAARYNTELSRSLLETSEKAMKIFEDVMRSVDLQKKVNVHTDLHPRNLFWTDNRFLIIDWESASHGHPYFDLASLSVLLALGEQEEKELLEGYFGKAPTNEEMSEYMLLKRIRWAYTSVVNTMWAFRVLEKEPCNALAPPELRWYDYMQSFGETKEMPSLKFFVDVAILSLNEAMNIPG